MWIMILELAVSTGAVGILVKMYVTHRKSHDRIERSLRIQHRRDMKAIYVECSKLGFVDDQNEEDFQELWDIYIEQHGNSYAKKIKDRFDGLPREEIR
jgi:hypothetical protein